MLFSKLKHKDEELLPPPPPFPSMGLEEEKKPELFDEIIKPKKVKASPEEEEFEDLLKEVEDLKPKKSAKKYFPTKKQKIPKKEVKIKKIPIKKVKEKEIPIKKIAQIKQIKKIPVKKIKTTKKIEPRVKLPELEGLKEPKFELPKELEEPIEKELELPETLEELDIEKELEQEKTKPKELIEAEDEIKTAIERIKEQEKPSIFKRLFTNKEKITTEEQIIPITEVNTLSILQNKINETRQALMRFDLETAKKNYIEIMKIYNRISPEEQAKFYHDVRDLYFERKSAEELKV